MFSNVFILVYIYNSLSRDKANKIPPKPLIQLTRKLRKSSKPLLYYDGGRISPTEHCLVNALYFLALCLDGFQWENLE